MKIKRKERNQSIKKSVSRLIKKSVLRLMKKPKYNQKINLAKRKRKIIKNEIKI